MNRTDNTTEAGTDEVRFRIRYRELHEKCDGTFNVIAGTEKLVPDPEIGKILSFRNKEKAHDWIDSYAQELEEKEYISEDPTKRRADERVLYVAPGEAYYHIQSMLIEFA